MWIKKIDDFDILYQQAIEDINNAGNGQIESINIAGQKALENIGTGIDPTFTREGKAADAAATGVVIDELKEDKVHSDSVGKETTVGTTTTYQLTKQLS